VSVEADERAELIAAVTRTSEMVGALLDLVDRIVVGWPATHASGRRTSPRALDAVAASNMSDFVSGSPA
jgi:hypothetical protein